MQPQFQSLPPHLTSKVFRDLAVTICVGAAAWPDTGVPSPQNLLWRADEARKGPRPTGVRVPATGASDPAARRVANAGS